MSKPLVTADEVRRLLNYSPDTGVFVWRVNRRGTARAGSIAGVHHNVHKNKWYVYIAIRNRRYLAHRLAWLYVHGDWPTKHIDHIDGNGFNNRLSNLREANQSENMRNTGLYSNNTSGFRGVFWNKTSGRWQARIKSNGTTRTLGYFDTKELAYECYLSAATELHGKFSRVANQA